jgi:hypothetical protein
MDGRSPPSWPSTRLRGSNNKAPKDIRFATFVVGG